MKALALLLCSFVAAVTLQASDVSTELSLQDGSRIKGRVMSTSASEVTVLSDFGVFRIPLEKLTAESRASLTQAGKPDVDALLRRIAELEGKVAQLQQENDALRLRATQSPGASSSARSMAPSEQSTGLQYSVSSTGKRHNSRCRYFSSGRPAGPTDGVARKICGG